MSAIDAHEPVRRANGFPARAELLELIRQLVPEDAECELAENHMGNIVDI